MYNKIVITPAFDYENKPKFTQISNMLIKNILKIGLYKKGLDIILM